MDRNTEAMSSVSNDSSYNGAGNSGPLKPSLSTSKWLCKMSLKKQIYIYNLNLSTVENFHG